MVSNKKKETTMIYFCSFISFLSLFLEMFLLTLGAKVAESFGSPLSSSFLELGQNYCSSSLDISDVSLVNSTIIAG